ncbi:MAG: hydantoinase/oxoprolinase family protein [Deltaproteobacteria bacterium]|nr:hydantoinase/oxoprolinase family protein [Deltaproteobacteria bacterium]
MFEIVVDTGGTFTDAVLLDEERKISMAKYPTNVENPSESIMGCIEALAQERHMTDEQLLGDTDTLVIGTTLPTNTVVEKNGAKCCLLHTEGFRDIPELGRRIPKDDIYNLKLPAPDTLIRRHLRYGIEERMQFNGEVITPVNKESVLEAIAKAKKENVEVPVVCFLHSYMNPENEEKAAEIIKAEYPEVVISSKILRRWMEWDRLGTAILAGYVKVVASRFVRTLDERLKKANFRGTWLLSTCIGGVASPDLALDNPALLIGSGPASGPLLGRFLAQLSGIETAIVYDMGGTTCDISIINALESVDVASIGAGGGSIAWIDDRGILQIGPASAGAEPGPACYGRGGERPTVTDADVVLGYIPADYFLGGKISLDNRLAESVIGEHVAGPLNIDTTEAAHVVSSLVEDNMSQGIFLSAIEKGLDPREFVLFVGGGAGPVHAVAIAARLGIDQIYIPKQASVFCALGGALADYEYVINRCLYRRDDEVTIEELKSHYDSLAQEGVATLKRQGVADDEMKLIRGAEMRYFGQLRDLEVSLPDRDKDEPFTDEVFKALISKFHEKHQAIYGWSDESMAVAIASLKLRAVGVRPAMDLIKLPSGGADPSAALKRQRQVYFKELGGFTETPCYDSDRLQHGNVIVGPAIVEDTKTTVVVPKGAELTVDAYGNFIIRR